MRFLVLVNRQNQVINNGAVNQTEHVFDILMLNRTLTIGNRLIGQRQGITQRTLRRFSNLPDRILIRLNAFFAKNIAQMFGNFIDCQWTQSKLQTARNYGNWQFLRISGCKQKFDMFWRFFQRL